MFGWTWEYIDDFVTIPRLLEITAYWRQVPPLHEAFAGFVGALNKDGPTSGESGGEADENHDLMQELLGAGFQLPPGVTP